LNDVWTALLILLLSLPVGACTSDEFVHGLLQTVYNSGKYLCRQSPGNCDVPPDDKGPATSSNRR
jgi:hypothetical protein